MPEDEFKTVRSGIAVAPGPKNTWIGDQKDLLDTKVVRAAEARGVSKSAGNAVSTRFAEAQRVELRSRIHNLAQISAQEIVETRKLGRLQPLVVLLGPTEIINEVNARLWKALMSKLTVDIDVSNTIVDKVHGKTTRNVYLTLRDGAGKVVDQVIAIAEQSAQQRGNRDHLRQERLPRLVQAVRDLVSRIKNH